MIIPVVRPALPRVTGDILASSKISNGKHVRETAYHVLLSILLQYLLNALYFVHAKAFQSEKAGDLIFQMRRERLSKAIDDLDNLLAIILCLALKAFFCITIKTLAAAVEDGMLGNILIHDAFLAAHDLDCREEVGLLTIMMNSDTEYPELHILEKGLDILWLYIELSPRRITL